MKLKFEAMVATAGKDIDGQAFSIPDLETMREKAIGKKVSVNFLHVLESEVKKAMLTDCNELFIEGWVELNRSLMGQHWEIYVVPGYITYEGGEAVEDLIEFGFTYNPSDENLTPVKFYEFGG